MVHSVLDVQRGLQRPMSAFEQFFKQRGCGHTQTAYAPHVPQRLRPRRGFGQDRQNVAAIACDAPPRWPFVKQESQDHLWWRGFADFVDDDDVKWPCCTVGIPVIDPA